MAVSYAPTKLRVPPGFQNLLEGLAREVLREQPEDILSFAAQYFKTQLAIREETGKDDAKKGADMEKLMKGEAIDIDQSDPGLNEAATKIQASFRGHKARKEVQEKKEADAAVKIQASFRGHQTRKELSKKQEGGEAAPEGEAASEPAPEAKEETKEEVKEEEAKESTTEEAKAETTEETKAEGAEEVDIDLEDPEVQKAALTIQSSFRGHKARESVKSMKTENTEGETQGQEEPVAQQEAAPETQTEEVDIDLEDPEVQKAALTIQSSFRGHKAREDVKKMKSDTEITDEKGDEVTEAAPAADEAEEKPSEETAPAETEEVDIDLNDPEVAKAATTIQASFRGHQTRKQMKEGKQETETTEQEGQEEEKAEEPAETAEEQAEAQGEEAS